jgi:SAM-dependent methyltransferase
VTTPGSQRGPSSDRTCPACGGRSLVASERIATARVAAAWRREDEAVAAETLDRASALASVLPDEIGFDRCEDCGLETAVPAVVWSAGAYPRDQSYPLRWEFERCAEDLGPVPLDVLELGCGPGHFLAAASRRGHRAVGVDFSDGAVGLARAAGHRAFCGGFDELARHLGPDARFDAVACFHLIEHLADPGQLLEEIAPWVRPDARLFFSCPGPRRFTRLIPEQQAGASDFWDYPPHHVLRWTLPALRSLAQRHGWHVVTAVEEPFSWVAAASQIGVVRATYSRQLHHAAARRAGIARAWCRLLFAPSRRAGVSLYVCFARGAARPGVS